MQGTIESRPCEQGNATACDYCSYRSVCGFDVKIDGYEYRKFADMTEEEIMEKIRQENSGNVEGD